MRADAAAAGPTPPARVVVAGGGVAAWEAALALRAHATPERLAITLLAPDARLHATPQSVLVPFGSPAPAPRSLAGLVADIDAEHRQGTLVGVDVAGRRARTTGAGDLPYDALLVAIGTRPGRGVDGAIPFRGAYDAQRVRDALDAVVAAGRGTVALVVPDAASWSLPAYELALLTAARFRDAAVPARVLVVTPEPAPLAAFGSRAAGDAAATLDRHGVAVHVGVGVDGLADGALRLTDGRRLAVDHAIVLPAPRARPVAGLPTGRGGFLPVDEEGRVPGCPGVYAAGDATDRLPKQGGLACQQADTAAAAIAGDLGLPVAPVPYRPVLRAVLLSDEPPRSLRAVLGDASALQAPIQPHAWPGGKVIGHHLGAYLEDRSRSADPPVVPQG